ncbi:MAG: hypothetical protein Q9M22_01120 [Mariprofundaceae bacterium]|nr:hypothetical protein [Mariprofundaceae bacterium]
MEESDYQLCVKKIDALRIHLDGIDENHHALQAENQRLREVIRLGELEAQKCRNQMQELEEEITAMQMDKNEAKGRVENAIARLDQMMDHNAES